MFVRFMGAFLLLLGIALTGLQLEKKNLDLRRAVGLQHYRLNVIEGKHAAKKVKVHQMGSPARLIDALEESRLQVRLLGPMPNDPPTPSIANQAQQPTRVK